MSAIATAIVGSAIVGGVVSSRAAGKAADAQGEASRLASETELKQYEQNRTDMAPWREAGTGALGQLTAGTGTNGDFSRDFNMSDFTREPGYAFRQEQGQRGFEASAAARGGLMNGGALKALSRYNQDYASGEYQNAYNRFNNDRTQRFNRLASIAGVGQTATRDVAQQGAQVANSVGNNLIGAGNAQASSYVGQGNAVTGTLGQLGNYAMQRGFMGQGSGGGAGGGGFGTSAPYGGGNGAAYTGFGGFGSGPVDIPYG